MINEKLLILPYLCDDYEKSYRINKSEFEFLTLICNRLTKINSYIGKCIKEIMESKLLNKNISSSKNEDNFIELFSIIQIIIDRTLNENYKMINKIIELLTDLKHYYTSYFKIYDNFINIQKQFTNKLLDIEIQKNNFLKSTKNAEIFTYQFLKNKVFNIKINKNDFKEKEDLKQLAKIELDKYKSIINKGNNELKLFNDNQRHLFRTEKELKIKYNEIYSTSIMTSLEYQLKINQYSDKINEKVLKLNNNNSHELLDYLKNFKPKEEIDFVKYRTNIEFDNCNNDLELSVNFMAYKEIEHILGKHNDIDFLEASKKLEMIKEVNRIFDLDDKITEEDLEKLKEILKSDLGQNVFIKQLNTFRAKGYYVKSEKFVISMGEILNIILELAEKDKNYNYAKNCIILSQTFCYLDLNKEKKSIFRFIKDNKWLKGSQFWRGFIDFMIKNELEKANTFKTPNLNNIIFTQLVTYINNMKEFEIDIGIISKIVDEFVEKYNYLNKESYNALLSVIYKDIKKIEVYPKECKDNSKLKKQLIIYNKYMIN